MKQSMLADPEELAPPGSLSALRDLQELHRVRARTDSAAFASYVLRDEITGRPIRMMPQHYEWHQLLSLRSRLVLWAHIEAGKSQSCTIARTLWDLGRNPNLRCVILCRSDDLAVKTTMLLARYINGELGPEVHQVFPGLRRAKGMQWTQHRFTVERTVQSRDPSVQALAVHGKIMGARVDRLRIDDILDFENAWSLTEREKLWEWYLASLPGRLSSDAEVSAVGNVWHEDDILHRFARQTKVWAAYSYPAAEQLQDKSWTSLWPERWPLDRLHRAEEEMGSFEYQRQLLNVAQRIGADSRFPVDDIKKCVQAGNGMSLVRSIDEVKNIPRGCAVYAGVDMGTGTGGDLSCIFTILVYPNGVRRVLLIESGQWKGPELVERIEQNHHRFGSIVIVESNAQQRFIIQMVTAGSDVPVVPFNTSKKSYLPGPLGIESMAIEMANGKWLIPSANGRVAPEVREWIKELMRYNPEQHPGDRLMASHFAVQGSKFSRPKGRSGLGLDVQSR
jgi:hypothetical protein